MEARECSFLINTWVHHIPEGGTVYFEYYWVDEMIMQIVSHISVFIGVYVYGICGLSCVGGCVVKLCGRACLFESVGCIQEIRN